MKVLAPSIMLIDVLSGWGLHELRKYPGIRVPADPSGRVALGIEVVLRHVPELISRILLAQPLDPVDPGGAFRAELNVEDVAQLRLHSGAWLSDWPGTEHLQRLIQAPDPTPIVCIVQVDGDHPDSIVGPITIFDGWHRARACLVSGGAYPLTAEIIKTRRPLVGIFKVGGRAILEI